MAVKSASPIFQLLNIRGATRISLEIHVWAEIYKYPYGNYVYMYLCIYVLKKHVCLSRECTIGLHSPSKPEDPNQTPSNKMVCSI